MNIGFVSTWFERGAAYVTKAYIDALNNVDNNLYVYARGGESFAKGNSTWDRDYVTWGLRLAGTNINKKHIYSWIIKNNIEVLFFNEQHEFSIVASIKKDFKNLKVGAYIDYYKEDTIELFNIYDFIICNTRRHYEAFSNHKQKYYVPWGTNIDLFSPVEKDTKKNEGIVFFHSAGMSKRKGTSILIDAYIQGELFKNSRLIIHSQADIEFISGYNREQLKKYNIEIIEKTVKAPGLYYMGDVYVYPTKLEGLGLTMYEALACGLPVITTNNPPMNEVINDNVGKLVEVEKTYCRSDGYYWPLTTVSKVDLINKMNFYISNSDKISEYKINARKYAEANLNWRLQYSLVNDIFKKSEIQKYDEDLYKKIIEKEKKDRMTNLRLGLSMNNWLYHFGKTITNFKK
jgi:glycosyltransferase involved in cell wall biosynthesis